MDDVMGLEEEEIIHRNKSTAELIRFGQWKEKLLAQKSKARWLRDGDVNSSYFHGWINRNKKFNMIEGLSINGRWSDSVEEVKRGVHDHFKLHFRGFVPSRPVLPIYIFSRSIDTCSNQSLTVSFTEEEVKTAVWACDIDKSPGPYGYSFGFIKECWEDLKGEILDMMSEFHQHGRFPKGLNPFFVEPARYIDPISAVMGKLKRLKLAPRPRNKHVFGDIDRRIAVAQETHNH
ncbi:hypothetical protein ACS0TY_022060 [Phlomoides rotata]